MMSQKLKQCSLCDLQKNCWFMNDVKNNNVEKAICTNYSSGFCDKQFSYNMQHVTDGFTLKTQVF